MSTYCAPCLADLALVREAVTSVSGTAACVAHAVLLTHPHDTPQRRLSRLSELRAMAEGKLPTASAEDVPAIELLVQEYALAGAMDMTVPLKDLAGDRTPRPPKTRNRGRDRGKDRDRPEGERGPRPEGERGPRPEGERGPRPEGERGPRPERTADATPATPVSPELSGPESAPALPQPDNSQGSGAPAPAAAPEAPAAPAPTPEAPAAPAPAAAPEAPAAPAPAAAPEAPAAPAPAPDAAPSAPEQSGRDEQSAPVAE